MEVREDQTQSRCKKQSRSEEQKVWIYEGEGSKSPYQKNLRKTYCQKRTAQHDVCVPVQEKIPQRRMTYVCQCKRRSHSVAWRMCASAREDPTAWHDVCVPVQEKIPQRSMTYVQVAMHVITPTPPHPNPTPNDRDAYFFLCAPYNPWVFKLTWTILPPPHPTPTPPQMTEMHILFLCAPYNPWVFKLTWTLLPPPHPNPTWQRCIFYSYAHHTIHECSSWHERYYPHPNPTPTPPQMTHCIAGFYVRAWFWWVWVLDCKCRTCRGGFWSSTFQKVSWVFQLTIKPLQCFPNTLTNAILLQGLGMSTRREDPDGGLKRLTLLHLFPNWLLLSVLWAGRGLEMEGTAVQCSLLWVKYPNVWVTFGEPVLWHRTVLAVLGISACCHFVVDALPKVIGSLLIAADCGASMPLLFPLGTFRGLVGLIEERNRRWKPQFDSSKLNWKNKTSLRSPTWPMQIPCYKAGHPSHWLYMYICRVFLWWKRNNHTNHTIIYCYSYFFGRLRCTQCIQTHAMQSS